MQMQKMLSRHAIASRYINDQTEDGWKRLWNEVNHESKGPFLVQVVSLHDGLQVDPVGLYQTYDEAKTAFIKTINDNREEPLSESDGEDALDSGWWDIGATHVVFLDLSNWI